MLQALRNKQREDGFTLIELMVVVLIIAILIAIAVPTFLGARERSQDKAAQSGARNALTAAKVIYTDNSDYTEATATELGNVEPSLTFVAAGTASTGPTEVSVSTTTSDFYAAVLSEAGDCFYIHDSASSGGGTEFGSGTTACTGTVAADGTSVSYSSSW